MRGLLRASYRFAGVGAITFGRLAQFQSGRHLFTKPAQRHFALNLIHRWGGDLVELLGLEVKVNGYPPGIPSLWVGNHRSYLDIAVLASVRPCLFLAKDEIGRWPLFGSAARAGGMVFVKRNDAVDRKRALSEVAERLRSNIPLVVFPEGTTSEGPGLLPFRPGVFRLSYEAGVKLTPFAVHYPERELAWIGDDTFVGHFMRTQTRQRRTVEISFGTTLHPGDFSGPLDLRDTVHASVQNLLEKKTQWQTV